MGSKPSPCVGSAGAEGSPCRAAPSPALLALSIALCPMPGRNQDGSLQIGTCQVQDGEEEPKAGIIYSNLFQLWHRGGCRDHTCPACKEPQKAGNNSLLPSQPWQAEILQDPRQECSESDQRPGLVSRIWLYFAVQKSFGALRRHEKHRLCHADTAAPFGPSGGATGGDRKILPHLACSVICSLNFIKIKTQRSLRHSCVPTDVNGFRSLRWRLSSVPRTKPTFAATIGVGFCP